jgi:hypothetical protein
VATPDLEATLRLPNLERRLKVFVTNENLRQSPTDPTLDRNPLRAGLRFMPLSHIDSVDGASGVEPRPALCCAMPRSRRAWGALRTPPFVKPFDSRGSSQMPVGCCMTGPANVRTDCGGFVNRAGRSRVQLGATRCEALQPVSGSGG